MSLLATILRKRASNIRKFGYSSIVRSTIDELGVFKKEEQNELIAKECVKLKLTPTFGVLCIGLLPITKEPDKADWEEIRRLELHKKVKRAKRK